MATKPDPAPLLLSEAPLVMPVTSLPANIHPGFVVGSTDRLHDTRTVAYAILCQADMKVGDREFTSTSVGLHEIVFLRRLYEEQGGDVRPSPSWPPGIRRVVPLTQEQLKAELTRMRDLFVVPRPNNGSLNIIESFLGVEPAEQTRKLHAIMKKQIEAWGKLLEVAKARIPAAQKEGQHPEVILSMACDQITPRELANIADMADDSRAEGEDLALPEVLLPKSDPFAGDVTDSPVTPVSLADLEAQANAEVDAAGDPQAAVVARLVADAGLNQSQALAVATLADLMEGTEIPDADLADAVGSKAKTKLDAVRRALKA